MSKKILVSNKNNGSKRPPTKKNIIYCKKKKLYSISEDNEPASKFSKTNNIDQHLNLILKCY